MSSATAILCPIGGKGRAVPDPSQNGSRTTQSITFQERVCIPFVKSNIHYLAIADKEAQLRDEFETLHGEQLDISKHRVEQDRLRQVVASAREIQ